METIQGAFERQVARSPQSAAVIEGADRSQRLSYSELSNASKQVRQVPRHSHVHSFHKSSGFFLCTIENAQF